MLILELAKIRGHHPCVRDGRLVLVLQGVQEVCILRADPYALASVPSYAELSYVCFVPFEWPR